MKIRNAQGKDLDTIRRIHELAFSGEENGIVMEVAGNLLSEATDPPILSLVAELDGKIIGHVSFSPIFPGPESKLTGYILAPLAVLPDRQKKGVGSRLVNEGKRILSDHGVDILLVYGDPDYYGRFGFREEIARCFIPPCPLQYPFGWQGLLLGDCTIGDTSIPFQCVESLSRPDIW